MLSMSDVVIRKWSSASSARSRRELLSSLWVDLDGGTSLSIFFLNATVRVRSSPKYKRYSMDSGKWS